MSRIRRFSDPSGMSAPRSSTAHVCRPCRLRIPGFTRGMRVCQHAADSIRGRRRFSGLGSKNSRIRDDADAQAALELVNGRNPRSRLRVRHMIDCLQPSSHPHTFHKRMPKRRRGSRRGNGICGYLPPSHPVCAAIRPGTRGPVPSAWDRSRRAHPRPATGSPAGPRIGRCPSARRFEPVRGRHDHGGGFWRV